MMTDLMALLVIIVAGILAGIIINRRRIGILIIKSLVKVIVEVTNVLKGWLGIKSPSKEFKGGNKNEQGSKRVRGNTNGGSGHMHSSNIHTSWSSETYSGDNSGSSNDNSYD